MARVARRWDGEHVIWVKCLRAAALSPLLNSTSRSTPWAAAQTGLEGRLSPRPSRLPGSFTARFARRNGHVSGASVHTAKCRRLGGTRISGFEPLVSNHSFGAIFDCGFEAFQPCRFSDFSLLPLLFRGGVGYFSHKSLIPMKYSLPASPLPRGGAERYPPETARLKCQ